MAPPPKAPPEVLPEVLPEKVLFITVSAPGKLLWMAPPPEPTALLPLATVRLSTMNVTHGSTENTLTVPPERPGSGAMSSFGPLKRLSARGYAQTVDQVEALGSAEPVEQFRRELRDPWRQGGHHARREGLANQGAQLPVLRWIHAHEVASGEQVEVALVGHDL